MCDNIPSFVSFQVDPKKETKVTIRDGEEISLTSVSILPNEKSPKSGRVVLYATPLDENGKKGDSIAIAPLRIGEFEVAKIDYQLNCFQPIVFSTKGAEIPIVVSGSSEVTNSITIEKL